MQALCEAGNPATGHIGEVVASACSVARRAVLGDTRAHNNIPHTLYHAPPCTTDEAAPKFYKTANGVRVQELAVGKGPEAHAGDAVLIDFVLRRANGYFIYGEEGKAELCGLSVLQALARHLLVCGFLCAARHFNTSQRRVSLAESQPDSRACLFSSTFIQSFIPHISTQRMLCIHTQEPWRVCPSSPRTCLWAPSSCSWAQGR